MTDFNYIQFYYRHSRLRLTEPQRVKLETLFGMVRVLVNHLVQKLQSFNDIHASNTELTFEECETILLRYLNDNEFSWGQEDYLQPAVLKGIVLAYISEWEDFRHKRNRRPPFRSFQDEQQFWVLDPKFVSYSEDRFTLFNDPDLSFTLPPSRIPLPRSATAHLLQRGSDGYYTLSSLHERICMTPHPDQDPIITNWGARIVQSTQKTRHNRRRQWNTAASRQRQTEVTDEAMILRKITLDRLLRQRNEKIQTIQQQQIEAA